MNANADAIIVGIGSNDVRYDVYTGLKEYIENHLSIYSRLIDQGLGGDASRLFVANLPGRYNSFDKAKNIYQVTGENDWTREEWENVWNYENKIRDQVNRGVAEKLPTLGLPENNVLDLWTLLGAAGGFKPEDAYKMVCKDYDEVIADIQHGR